MTAVIYHHSNYEILLHVEVGKTVMSSYTGGDIIYNAGALR